MVNKTARRKFIKKILGSFTLAAMPFPFFGMKPLKKAERVSSSFEYHTINHFLIHQKMRIAYILFDDLTLLDFIGIYDPLSRIKSQKHLSDFEWDLCALKPSIKDSFGLEVAIDKVKPDLSSYDMIIIPGGFGTRSLQSDLEFVQWIEGAQKVPYKVSICTGSLLLGAAGLLTDKTATTHFNEYEALKQYGCQVVPQRIVDDANVITAGAVASSLDLGLYLCEKLVGPEKAEEIRKSMDYTPGKYTIIEK